jgi:hypothetical protein
MKKKQINNLEDICPLCGHPFNSYEHRSIVHW